MKALYLRLESDTTLAQHAPSACAVYRSLLRVQRRCPAAFASRLALNIREAFELRRDAPHDEALRYCSEGQEAAASLAALLPLFRALDAREAHAKR